MKKQILLQKTYWKCGCITWKENAVFTIEPCIQKESCPVYRAVIEESKRRFNKLEYRITT